MGDGCGLAFLADFFHTTPQWTHLMVFAYWGVKSGHQGSNIDLMVGMLRWWLFEGEIAMSRAFREFSRV